MNNEIRLGTILVYKIYIHEYKHGKYNMLMLWEVYFKSVISKDVSPPIFLKKM